MEEILLVGNPNAGKTTFYNSLVKANEHVGNWHGVTVEEKKKFLLREHIAVWDVIAKCDIIGSSDSSIRNVVPADLSRILDHAPIRQIYANGGKAYELYQKYAYPITGREIVKLPSTSPANAAWQMERLLEAWAAVKENLG